MNNTPAFQQVLSIVACFTFLAGVGSVGYSLKDSLSPQQARVAELCNTSWNIGFGAIVGLLGSQAINKPPSEDEE